MATRRVLAAGICGALALSAPAARAQSPVVLEGFAARADRSSAPVFGGLALGGYSGPFGLRVSGSLNTTRTPNGPTYYDDGYGCQRGRCPNGYGYGADGGSTTRVAAWTADADLLFEPFRAFGVGRALLLGFSPYVFGGVGYYSARPASAADTGLTTVNYGVGVRHELLGWLGVTGEARFRRALNGDSTVLSFNRHNAQYRVGLTVSFGGGHAHRQAPVIVRGAPGVIGGTGALGPCAGGACGPVPTLPAASMAAVGARVVPRVLDLADGFVGTPYVSGGTTPAGGFDAAGFVQYVFGREGLELPRTVRQLAQTGMTVSTRTGNLRPGDLLFFANDGVTPDHVAIYAGRDRILHATGSGGSVRYDVLGEGARGAWFSAHLVAARRVVDGAEAPDRLRRDIDAAPATDDAPARPDQAPQPGTGPG